MYNVFKACLGKYEISNFKEGRYEIALLTRRTCMVMVKFSLEIKQFYLINKQINK